LKNPEGTIQNDSLLIAQALSKRIKKFRHCAAVVEKLEGTALAFTKYGMRFGSGNRVQQFRTGCDSYFPGWLARTAESFAP
jgi:hypothetical protein